MASRSDKSGFSLLIQKAVWRGSRLVNTFSWSVIVAVLMALTCGLFFFHAVFSSQEKIDMLQSEITAVQTSFHTEPILPQQAALTHQLAQLYLRFPERKAVSEPMSHLYNAAAEQNINLDQGEYAFSVEPGGKLARYDIVLPVRGGYVQIRKFIAQALNELPTLSLDSIAFGRQKIDDVAIDAQLKMTLYLRQE